MTAATSPEDRWRLGYRPALDGVRGIAILLVLFTHSGLPGLPDGGAVGVTLFFVLSGFLITAILIGEHGSTGSIDLVGFYKRRALRLLPALVATVAVVTGLLLVLGRGAEIAGIVVPPLFYFGNWAMAAGAHLGPLSHTWSLSVEEQFYAIWPVALVGAMAVGRTRLSLLIAIAGAMAIVAWRGFLWPDSGEVSVRLLWATDMRGDALLMGCAVALLASRGWRVPEARAVALTSLAAVGFFALRPPITGDVLFTLAAVVSASLLWSLDSWSPRWLAWRPLVYVGTISYGLYLWHGIPRLLLASADLPPLVVSALLLGATFALAFLSWRYVETPFLRMKDRSAHSVHPELAGRVGGVGGVDRTARVLP